MSINTIDKACYTFAKVCFMHIALLDLFLYNLHVFDKNNGKLNWQYDISSSCSRASLYSASFKENYKILSHHHLVVLRGDRCLYVLVYTETLKNVD